MDPLRIWGGDRTATGEIVQRLKIVSRQAVMGYIEYNEHNVVTQELLQLDPEY